MCVIPLSQSSSSRNIESTMGRVMAIAPTTSRTVSWIKPFLLGFAVAFVLCSVAALSSIHALCRNYIPANRHPSKIVLGERIPLSHQASDYHCSNPMIAKMESEKVERAKKLKRHLVWREAIPFLSYYVPKRKKMAQQDHNKENTAICNEERPLQREVSPWRCLCHLVGIHSDRNEMLEKAFIEDHTNNFDSSTSKQKGKLEAKKQFSTAFTPEIPALSVEQEHAVKNLRNFVFDRISEFEERASLVPWGGPSSQAIEAASFDWYARARKDRGIKAPLDQVDGANLFLSYLRIMKWPTDFKHTDFPFKLCKEKKKIEGKGCDASIAIQHTLEFRERYRPWLITPGIKRANSNGLVYTRGFSPPHSENEVGGHAIVWLRLALKVKTRDETDRIFFVRSMIREFDRAVAIALQRSDGRVGKFNTVVDGENFTWSSMPSLSAVKGLVAVLQDHFADRLGVVILVNVGSTAELLLKLFLPLITEEVRNKIVMLPRDPRERLEALQAVLGPISNIPVGLGGTDEFEFDLDEYYRSDFVAGDEEALEYLTTMPYHA